ncbi:hypothetical protein KM903_17950 [Bacillus glycinifermentans]|uniref:Small peptidoglycan-associated lipoprotein n=4 Tax=Bacillaceae TaxID=186817 RepID=A0AAJ3Z426_9BACI|nr:membrane protein [Bacillus sp. TH008]MBU8788226.1 hypothetical protein [Bacillus glycinifermentans]NUJ18454.1 hypothetical protein [Bacillus glycinifermentans]QAT67822.1 hypothetical protein EQZ20_08620 [Bacillus glycinifermentans]SCA85495.1 small peptidoglycan-associated lipoprotein [Bacillus glycinifermentans]
MLCRAVITAVCILFFASGCSLSHISADQNEQNDNTHRVKLLFFSDDEHMEQEVAYYDALMDLKQEFPKQVSGMEILHEKGDWKKDVHTFPSLLLVHDKKVLVKIEGKIKDKAKIVELLRKQLKK